MGRSAMFVLALGACAHSIPEGDGDGGADPDAAVDAIPGDDAGDPDGPPGDAPPVDAAIDAAVDGAVDAMPATMTWRDDSAADFAVGTLTDAAVEAYGAVTPAAYYTGGLLWRAADNDTFGAAAAATWAQVIAFPSTGKVAIARGTAASWGTDTPPSVGLTGGDDWTMWFEGEVFLDAGTYTFELLVDDHGFVELAPSPSAAFVRVASCDWPDPASGTFTAPTAGWYPIRAAASEGAVDASIQLRAQGPGLATLAPIPRHRLRARVNGVVGLFQSGFDDGHLVGDVEHTIDAVTPASTSWNTGNPGDLGMTASDDFSVRWTGQLRVDSGGAFTFRYVTDDGQRLWVNGQKLLDAWDDQTHDQTSAAVTLAPGWHDLVVDQTERAGGAAALLSVASGPELSGQTLPLDRLRPVEGRAERFESGVDRTDRAIPDQAQAPDSTVVVTAPAGATVTSIDVSYTVTHSYWGDLEIRLIAPDGTAVLLRDNAGSSSSGTLTERLVRTDLNGRAVDGTWRLRVNDTQASDTGTLQDFQLTVHHAAGEPPIATTSAYESPVRDLGPGVTAITRVSWLERLPAGADLVVRMRTCDTAAACAVEPWSAPMTDPAGSTPAVTVRRHAQYRVELTSGGDRPPALDQLTVEYTVNP